jgi:hypothetical protein
MPRRESLNEGEVLIGFDARHDFRAAAAVR